MNPHAGSRSLATGLNVDAPLGRRPNARAFRAVGALLTGLSLLSQAPTAAQRPASSTEIVAVGDIHGAATTLTALLQQVGLLSAAQRWDGGRTTLVQTGDILDRGSAVRQVMDDLMRLEQEARAADGRVIVLLGNHEGMNLLHNLRDASPSAFDAFRDAQSEKRRAAGYEQYREHIERRSTDPLAPRLQPVPEHEWLAAHPPGLLEYQAALGPDGIYGRWLRSKDVVVRLGDTLFVHGGLHPDRTESIRDINRRARDEIARFDTYVEHLVERDVILPFFTFDEVLEAALHELQVWTDRLWPGPPAPGRPPVRLSNRDRTHLRILLDLMRINEWSLIDPDGPLWFRGYALWPEDEPTTAALRELLARHDAARLVMGHTISAAHVITQRFGGRAVLIDTGMLSSYYQGGRASALRVTGTQLSPIYLQTHGQR